jgi:hypothetical protein
MANLPAIRLTPGLGGAMIDKRKEPAKDGLLIHIDDSPATDAICKVSPVGPEARAICTVPLAARVIFKDVKKTFSCRLLTPPHTNYLLH